VLTVGSLFAGIGGFDLAAERAGLTVKWQVEIDPFCQRVLAKHWPNVKRYGDIKRVRYPAPVDIVCGGFPCQDISVAGKGAGLAGKRSGLWREMLRVVRAVRPRYVVVENVAALLGRGLGDVLGGLASSGYDAEWDCIPASAVGAPHHRDRVWIVAYSDCGRQQERCEPDRGPTSRSGLQFGRDVGGCGATVADSDSELRGHGHDGAPARGRLQAQSDAPGRRAIRHTDHWNVEPAVGRVAHGVPARVDRLRGLGNAIVPQVAEWIFRRIIEVEKERVA
jgi:DNA (cytosine-5)-methyltransferase 1